MISVDRRAGGVAVARVSGRLDFTSAPEARSQLSNAIASGHPKIIVDLGKADFVDSAGLGALIGGMRTARQNRGDLRVANPPDQAKTLLSLTQLDQVLTIYPTVEEAVIAFS
jgi:anti-sigma B factor antagonist